MKTTELRIGNLLEYYGTPVIVLEIFRNNDIELGYFSDSIGFRRKLTERHAPNPIPLTEEWFLKFGFTFNKGYSCYVYNDKFILNKSYVMMDIDMHVCLKYVHQIQNLYFALTGEELKII